MAFDVYASLRIGPDFSCLGTKKPMHQGTEDQQNQYIAKHIANLFILCKEPTPTIEFRDLARDERAPRASVIYQAAAAGIPRRQSGASAERRPHHKAKRSGRSNILEI